MDGLGHIRKLVCFDTIKIVCAGGIFCLKSRPSSTIEKFTLGAKALGILLHKSMLTKSMNKYCYIIII